MGARLPHGEIMPEEELYGLLKLSDSFDLVNLEEGFAKQVRKAWRVIPSCGVGTWKGQCKECRHRP